MTHTHAASFRFTMATGNGVEVGTCNCGARVHRPIKNGETPAANRAPWTLRDSEPLVSREDIENAHAEAMSAASTFAGKSADDARRWLLHGSHDGRPQV